MHLLSFLEHSNTTSYHLYLDGGGEIPERLSALLAHPRVTVSAISIEELLRHAGVPAMTGTLPGLAGGLLRFTYRVIAVLTRTRFVPIATGAASDLRYRADLFRCLIPAAHPGKSILYLDLDTVVSRPLHEVGARRSFTYRWEQFAFANTAVLYLQRHEGEVMQARIAERLRRAPNAKLWAFYTQRFCDELGLDVLPTEMFDPPWDRSSLWHGGAERFMTAHDDSAAMAAEVLDRFPIAHWHNQWRVVPEPGSAYQLLLKRFQADWAARETRETTA